MAVTEATTSASPSEGRSKVLDEAISAFEAAAAAFAAQFIRLARVRENYVRQAKAASKEIVDEVLSGKITAEEGAEKANKLRNALLDAGRLDDLAIGRALAEAQKATGLTLEQLQAKYASQLFAREFGQLTAAQQDGVFLEIAKAAGRPNARASAFAATLGKAGKGLLVVSFAFAFYNVATSDRPGRESVKQAGGIGAGVGGGMLAGAGAGLVCGPGAPFCVGIGVFIGGIAAAVGWNLAFDWLWK